MVDLGWIGLRGRGLQALVFAAQGPRAPGRSRWNFDVAWGQLGSNFVPECRGFRNFVTLLTFSTKNVDGAHYLYFSVEESQKNRELLNFFELVNFQKKLIFLKTQKVESSKVHRSSDSPIKDFVEPSPLIKSGTKLPPIYSKHTYHVCHWSQRQS